MHKSKISVGIRALSLCLALSLCSVFFGDLSYTEAKGATLKETSSKYEFNRLTDNECTELFDSLKTLTKSPTQTKSKRATNAYLIAKLYSVFKDMAPEIDSYAKVPAGYAYAGCTTSTQKKAVKWAIRCRLIDPDTFNAGKCPKRSTSYALVRKAVNIFMPEIEGFDLKNGSSKNVDLSKKTLKDKQVLSRLGIANTSTMKAGYLSKTDATRMSNNIKKIKSSLYTTATPEPTAIEPEPTTTPVPVPTSTPEPEDLTSSIEEDYIKVQSWLEENGYDTKYKKNAGVVFCSDDVASTSRVVYGNDMWTILIEYSDGYKKIKRIQSDENIMSYLEIIKEYTPAAH